MRAALLSVVPLLMLQVAVAAIYPVCDLASYPGVERASGAFGMKADELNSRLKEFNSAGVGVALDSPQDYEVVQRDAKNVGALRLRGKLTAAARQADALECRVGTEGKPGEGRRLDAGVKEGGRGVHFSGPGLREHAARCVEKVGPWLERQAPATDRPWQPQAIKTDADFRGLCAVGAEVAWVSGTKGTFGRTTDGGQTWAVGGVDGAEKLDFRDVEAFGDDTAYLLSAGPGEGSRIYKTTDGGKTWKLQFKNAEPKAFFDALAFWDEKHGIALSDPVDGRFLLVATDDGGATWAALPEKSRPAALPKEGAFAASGTCLVTRGENDVWFCTGGGKSARVFHSSDRGKTWQVTETPLLAGAESAGAFAIAFRDRDHGLIVGGDYRKPDGTGATVAVTADGGKTWKALEKRLPFRSGVAWAKDRWVTVGTSGSDVSTDDGGTWKPLDRENYNSVAFTATGDGWAVGPKGRVAKFVNGGEGKGRRAPSR